MSTYEMLPAPSHSTDIYKAVPAPNLALGTTAGLEKADNEDRIGYRITNGTFRLCGADAHWGAGAAVAATEHYLEDELQPFPTNLGEAVAQTEQLQAVLFTRFGKPGMDEEKDRTSETAFIALELGQRILRIVSYGDCRLLVVRFEEGTPKLIYKHPTIASWLGGFSMTGLLDRVPVAHGVQYHEQTVAPEDTILLYSDGIDECSFSFRISQKDLLQATMLADPEATLDKIFQNVFRLGANDNASLAVLRAQ